MGETKALDHGGRVEVGDVWQGDGEPFTIVRVEGSDCWWTRGHGERGPTGCSLVTSNYRLVSRVSPPVVAPGERRLAEGWKYDDWYYDCICSRCQTPLIGPKIIQRLVSKVSEPNHCAPCAEKAGAFADAAPRAVEYKGGCCSLGHPHGGEVRERPIHGSGRHSSATWCDSCFESHLESTREYLSRGNAPCDNPDCAPCAAAVPSPTEPPRPLTFDEANPRPAKAEKVGPPVCIVTQSDGKPCRTGKPALGRAFCPGRVEMMCDVCWMIRETRIAIDDPESPQLGRAPGIDRERIPERPAPKIRDIYLGEIDVDWVPGADR